MEIQDNRSVKTTENNVNSVKMKTEGICYKWNRQTEGMLSKPVRYDDVGLSCYLPLGTFRSIS